MPHPPTFETEMSSQGISALQLPTSERDLVDGVVSKAMPSAVTELPCDNVSLSYPPSSEENLPIPGALPSASSITETELHRHEGSMLLSSTSKRDPMNQELSTVMHSATPVDATGRGVSTSMPSSASDRMFSSQTSQWGETPMALQRSEIMQSTSKTIYTPLDSERIDVVASTRPREASAPTAERSYVPTMSLRNENMGMMSFRPPISERVYLPLMSQQNENVVATSQRPEVSLQSTPGGVYLSISKNDDVSFASLNGDVSLHQGSGSLNTACTSNVVPPQTTNQVPQLTEMYLAPAIQRNDGASSSSSSERIFIPSTSQEMYVQTPKISMEEYRRQGVS